MDDSRFFEFCFEAYKYERDEADRLYAKLPLGISANVVIAGAVGFLLTGDYFEWLFTRIDAFAFYAFAAISVTLLVISSVFLGLSLIPRKYGLLSLPHAWQKFRADAEARIRGTEYRYSEEEVAAYVAQHSRTMMMHQLCSLLCVNREINSRRTRSFVWAMRFTLLSLGAVLLQGIAALLLWVQFHS